MNLVWRGKSVFLIPYALCYGNEVVSFDFWKKLTTRLRKEGYEPVFNSFEEVVPEVSYILFQQRKNPKEHFMIWRYGVWLEEEMYLNLYMEMKKKIFKK